MFEENKKKYKTTLQFLLASSKTYKNKMSLVKIELDGVLPLISRGKAREIY